MSQGPSGPDVPPVEAPPEQGEPGRAGAPGVGVDAASKRTGASAADADGAPADVPPDAPDAPPEGDVTSELVRQLDERTADLQRLQAEYVNYKRRVDRDRQVVRETTTAAVLTGLLGVLDDLDRARQHGELTGGFKAVADSLERTVTGLGLERFGEPGEPFDPRVHEALMHEHSPEVAGPTAQTILQPGYRVGDRVLRPARVAVAEPPPAATDRALPTDPATDPANGTAIGSDNASDNASGDESGDGSGGGPGATDENGT